MLAAAFALQASYLALFELAAFLVYLVWMTSVFRRESFQTEQQLDRVRYMFDVQKTLFDAHMVPSRFEDALRGIASAVQAETAFLLILDGGAISEQYLWDARGRKPADLTQKKLEGVLPSFRQNPGSRIEYNPVSSAYAPDFGIRSYMLTPVASAGGGLAGVLGTCNMERRWEDAQPLECVALSFSAAVNNMRAHRAVRAMGAVDSMTGLLNRNSYNAAVAAAGAGVHESLACVYMDVNGLHEVNNHLGHREGDRMLQLIAGLVRREFGPDNSYRIGGDEFVALCVDQPRQALLEKVARVRTDSAARLYEISVGVEWCAGDSRMEQVVKAAEEKMRREKRRYYAEKGGERKNRELNLRLEKLITEKQDADAFLSVISDSFNGVYFVNLTQDSMRSLFIPEYFVRMLENSGGRFSRAIVLYAREMVDPDDAGRFERFCGFEELEPRLGRDEVPELVYKKRDGAWMRVRVLKFKRYTDEDRETLWIFSREDPPDGAPEK